jgi:hypothetical protein
MTQNSKATAWDLVGSLFWQQGRESARPSAAAIDTYLAGFTGARCALLGASTKALAERALALGLELTVFDFSSGMLTALRNELGDRCSYQLYDVLEAPPGTLRSRFDLIVADRLVNRFCASELAVFFANVALLLEHGGLLRTAVKIGFYPMDLMLMEQGKREGVLERFYDAGSRTFDYSRAEAVLEAAVQPHGTIPRPILLDWYRARGRESRFEVQDLVAALRASSVEGARFEEIRSDPYAGGPDTVLLSARLTRDR